MAYTRRCCCSPLCKSIFEEKYIVTRKGRCMPKGVVEVSSEMMPTIMGLWYQSTIPATHAFDSKFSIIKNRFWQIKKEERLACKIAA